MLETTPLFLTPNDNAGFSTEHLDKIHKSLNFLIESLEMGRNNTLMYISWVEKDIDDLLNRKLEQLTDIQVGAEIRALVMRKKEYSQKLQEQTSNILATKHQLEEVSKELNSRIQMTLTREDTE